MKLHASVCQLKVKIHVIRYMKVNSLGKTAVNATKTVLVQVLLNARKDNSWIVMGVAVGLLQNL